MHILLFGANGKVGSELVTYLEEIAYLTALTRYDCNLDNPLSADVEIEATRPDLVINATAFNGLEACQQSPEYAFTINGAVPAHMACACQKIGAGFIHMSTDYVFNGHPDKLKLTEDMLTNPVGLYGFTKLEGERAALAFNDKTVVFRLSTIYGNKPGGPTDALKQAKEGKGTTDKPIMVLHQFCNPTSARLIANAITAVVPRLSGQWSDLRGIYHLSSKGGVWKTDFSRLLLSSDAIIREGNLPIARPIYSIFDTTKFESTFGYALPTWREDLEATISNFTS